MVVVDKLVLNNLKLNNGMKYYENGTYCAIGAFAKACGIDEDHYNRDELGTLLGASVMTNLEYLESKMFDSLKKGPRYGTPTPTTINKREIKKELFKLADIVNKRKK